MHRYLYLESVAGSLTHVTPISQLLDSLLRSHAFRKSLALATGLALSNIERQHLIARRFRRGLDYILLNTHGKGQPQLDYTLNMTPTNYYYANTYGISKTSGEEVYMPAEYDAVELMFAGKNFTRARSNGSGSKNPMSWNKFSVILRCDGMQSLVKYMSYAASGDRWNIKGEVQLNNDVLDSPIIRPEIKD